MPMPLSATASSTQPRPSATLRTRSATSPAFVNLQALLKRLSRICLSRRESAVSEPRFSCASTTRRFLFSSASCPAVPMTSSIRLGIEFQLTGFDLREVKYLVDEAQEVGSGCIYTAQWFKRLFRAEARGVGDHHLGQPDDGVERRAQLVAHAGEELRLVLARQLKLPALVLDFVEQPHVLNGNHRLVGECRNQFDLLLAERTHGHSRQIEHADRDAFPHQRYSQDGANASTALDRLGPGVFGIGADVGNVNRLKRRSSKQRIAAWFD